VLHGYYRGHEDTTEDKEDEAFDRLLKDERGIGTFEESGKAAT